MFRFDFIFSRSYFVATLSAPQLASANYHRPLLFICYIAISCFIIKVSALCMSIYDNLKPEAKGRINGRLLRAASILHDITKQSSLTTKESHPETGGALLTKLGFPEMGSIIRQHYRVSDIQPDGPLREEEIVCYCDKRVKHATVVSLMSRKLDLAVRYHNASQSLEDLFEEYGILDRKIKRDLIRPLRDVIADDSVPTTFVCSKASSDIEFKSSFTFWCPHKVTGGEITFDIPKGEFFYQFVVDGKPFVDVSLPAKNNNGELQNFVLVK